MPFSSSSRSRSAAARLPGCSPAGAVRGGAVRGAAGRRRRDRGSGRSSADRGPLPQQPRREHPAEQPAEVPDPADPRRPGDRHLQDRPVQQPRHDPDADVEQVPVEEAAGHDVTEVSEDQPAGPDGQLAAALEQPHRQPAGHRHDERHQQELLDPAVRGEHTEDEQRHRVALDVLPRDVQERRGEDLRQPAHVVRHDAEIDVQPVPVGPVEHLQHPQERDERAHQHQRVTQFAHRHARDPYLPGRTPTDPAAPERSRPGEHPDRIF